MKYRKKPSIVEAITFDELVEHGKLNGGNIVNGMPWSFRYEGSQVTHENDKCYVITTTEGNLNMTPNHMLVTGKRGEVYPFSLDVFNSMFEKL